MNHRVRNRMLHRFYRQHGAGRYYYAMRRNQRRQYQGQSLLTQLFNILVAIAVIVAIAIW
jgi:hypothetical protein